MTERYAHDMTTVCTCNPMLEYSEDNGKLYVIHRPWDVASFNEDGGNKWHPFEEDGDMPHNSKYSRSDVYKSWFGNINIKNNNL